MSSSNAVELQHAHDQNQFLTFMLGEAVLAMRILTIKEIIEYGQPTEVPMMPAYIRGVINLRGAAVPVLDLAARLSKPSAEVTKKTCIVIVEAQIADGRQVIGLVVDAVNEVLDISSSEIEDAPMFGTSIRRDYIVGLGKINGQFVIILDMDQILSIDDAASLNTNAGVAA